MSYSNADYVFYAIILVNVSAKFASFSIAVISYIYILCIDAVIDFMDYLW